jgi:hypothetical protein
MKTQATRFTVLGCAVVLAGFGLSVPATGQNAATRKCFAGLQDPFAGFAKGLHAYRNVFRKANVVAPFPA